MTAEKCRGSRANPTRSNTTCDIHFDSRAVESVKRRRCHPPDTTSSGIIRSAREITMTTDTLKTFVAVFGIMAIGATSAPANAGGFGTRTSGNPFRAQLHSRDLSSPNFRKPMRLAPRNPVASLPSWFGPINLYDLDGKPLGERGWPKPMPIYLDTGD